MVKSTTVGINVVSSGTYVITISVSPTSLTAAGGTVIVTGSSNLPAGTVGNVRAEGFGGSSNTPFTVALGGSFQVSIAIPPNTSGLARNLLFRASATVGGTTYNSAYVGIVQSA